MPRVAKFLNDNGYNAVTAEDMEGAEADDYRHLNKAKKDLRIFITKDIKRCYKEIKNLLNNPGMIGIETLNPTQEEIISGMLAILKWSTKWPDFYQRVWIISHDSLVIYDEDGKKYKIV